MGSSHLTFIILTVCVFNVRDLECAEILDSHGVECPDNDIEVAKQHLDVLVPPLRSNRSGEAGVIGVVGGSIDSTGPPFFAAIAALRTGADAVIVLTTDEAAPVIKGYCPDLMVYPYLNFRSAPLINLMLIHMDVVIVGAGLGKSEESMTLLYFIIRSCRQFRKPIVVDGDAHFVISKQPTILKNYPSPGCILTPGVVAARVLAQVLYETPEWYNFWGPYVSVLIKGDQNIFKSPITSLSWISVPNPSGRHTSGEGDFLVGCMATLYHWALKKIPYCSNENQIQLYQSISTYSADILTKMTSAIGFSMYGRSLVSSDLINRIHRAFEQVFQKTNKN